MKDAKKLTPDEIVKEMRAMDKQIIDGPKPTIFKQTADLIDELYERSGKMKTEQGKFITNK